MSANTPRETYNVMRGFRYVLGRGTVSTGYYVTDAAGRVVSGPYTTEGPACDKADELEASALEAKRETDALIAQGLHELGDRRLALDLGVDLGPSTAAERAAHAELERAAGELGVTL